jgi:predicted PurR-regulated permease PerM
MSRFLRVLMLLASALLVWITLPIAAAVFAGAVLAVVLYPMQVRVIRFLRGRAAAAAAVVTLLAVVLVGGPLGTVAALALREVADEAVTLANHYDEGGVDGLLQRMPPTLRSFARGAANWLAWSQTPRGAERNPAPAVGGHQTDGDDSRDRGTTPAAPPATSNVPPGPADSDKPLTRLASDAASSAASVVAWLTAKVLRLSFDVAITILVVFCLLVWGAGLVQWLRAMAPLPPNQTDRLVVELRDTTRTVVSATLATAIVQTLVATLGYAVAGVGSLPLAAAVTFVAAMIPVFGGAVVTCAVGLLLLFQDEPGWGLFLIGWGVIVVNLTENFVTPLLCSRRIRMPAALLLFAMIGGIAVFGALGIVAGPLGVAFFRSVVEITRAYEPEPTIVPVPLA